MRISRRLFVVLLANDGHGKSTAIKALLSQGLGAAPPRQKQRHMLHSPGGRKIDAYIFVSAYQESEKGAHHSVEAALDVSESLWRERELVIFPSQRGGPEYASDISQMIDAAHKGGFDAICATLIMTGKDDRKTFEPVWAMNWDERWTLLNPKTTDDKWKEQVEAIGRDLWTWICCALAP